MMLVNKIPENEKLADLSLKELAELFGGKMEYMYFEVPHFKFNYPNSFEGDCLKIAHEMAKRVLEGESKND